MAALIDEPELQKELTGNPHRCQVAPQYSPRCISDIQLADKAGVMQASAVQVIPGFVVLLELLLVETGSLPKDFIFTRGR